MSLFRREVDYDYDEEFTPPPPPPKSSELYQELTELLKDAEKYHNMGKGETSASLLNRIVEIIKGG